MKIKLLYFDGCPSWLEGLENLKTALARSEITAEIHLIRVENDAQAAELKFLGSPSFQVNGEDWWPDERSDYHLSCRVYATPQGMRGAPSVEMLLEKLEGCF